MKPNVMEVILILAIFALMISQLPDPIEDLERDRAEYCRMVELNRSDKTLGWPDYKNIYKEVCTDGREGPDRTEP